MKKDLELFAYQPGKIYAKLAILGTFLIGFVYTFMWICNLILKVF